MNLYRSHNCGELNLNHIDKDVYISGWVNKKRDHGGLLFIDLRDEYGITQCVVNSDNSKFKILESLKLESVIKISGKVIRRSDDTINKSLPTGEIEVLSTNIEILSESEQIPFQVAVDDDSPEDLRLKYRYLDLRREKNHKNIILRSKVINSIRQKMIKHFPDTDGVLWFFDGWRKDLNTLCIIGRKYYERFGYIYHPDYKSFWCDAEFTEVANKLKKQVLLLLVAILKI